MAAIVVKQFGGLKPIVSARLLATSESQTANNVKLVSGSLLPLKGPTTLQALQISAPATIYRYGSSSNESNYWLEFANDTDVIRSPIAQDQYDRLYWTNGSGIPRYAPNSMILQAGSGPYPRASYQLGIPAPSAPSAVAGAVPEGPAQSFTFSASQIASLGSSAQLKVIVSTASTSSETILTISPVTAESVASALSTVTNLTAVVSGGGVSITPSSTVTTASISVRVGTSEPATYGAPYSWAKTTQSVVPETRVYVCTYVSAYGEEGPSSQASTAIKVVDKQPVTLTLPGGPTGSYNITLKRIYRSSAVGNNAQFQFVAEVPVATSSYEDSNPQADLGEVLMTEDWVAPPAGLKGLRVMANGAAVGFVDRTVYFSEPNLPHAWPHQYPVDFDIVGIATYGQYVAVLTTSYPYLFEGVDPAAMASRKLNLPQACVSKRSIVETGNGVIYASPDGLVEIGTQNDVVTRGLLNRDQWQAYTPSSIQSYVYNGRIHCFYNNGARGILIFDFSGQGATMTTSDLNANTAVTAGYYDASIDKLYLAQGTNIVRFDQGSAAPYTWKSKVFRTDYPTNFGFGQVNAYQYPVTMRVYADGQMVSAKVVNNNNQFRLPSGFRAYEWAFQLEGTGEVIEAAISQSTAELKQI